MRIINKTRYSTRALRSLVVACHQYLTKREGRLPRWKELRVEFGNRTYCTTGTHLWIGLLEPNIRPVRDAVLQQIANRLSGKKVVLQTTAGAAANIMHALMHTYGYEHSQWKDAGFEVGFAVQFLGQYLPLHIPKPRKPHNIIQDRYQRVLELERAWTRKLKLAQTKLKGLRVRKRYYTKKLAARETQ